MHRIERGAPFLALSTLVAFAELLVACGKQVPLGIAHRDAGAGRDAVGSPEANKGARDAFGSGGAGGSAPTADAEGAAGAGGMTSTGGGQGGMSARDGAGGTGPLVDGGVSTSGYSLVWQAAWLSTGVGPAVAIANGRMDTWETIEAFSPMSPPSNPTDTRALTDAQVQDLLGRLSRADTASFHRVAVGGDCLAVVYLVLCETCSPDAFFYNTTNEVSSAMATTLSWFDQVLGAASPANPSNYCRP